ncbi:MAG TPA: hypothetical protein PKL24_16325 [Polyangiaceae bacterium]|nr:hypothetical protein [Polyangiaceae bacterium]HOT09218.1 hypothetical protein [Polyangiaceae bacterium]HPB98709.1 hypothetical protein [Polyangiaceae bacterium]HPY20188.1 hypothetical protein [Polyangiaceae bacterium]HQB44729.1 hypothetical protein [Polyangiaceae bacterium]
MTHGHDTHSESTLFRDVFLLDAVVLGVSAAGACRLGESGTWRSSPSETEQHPVQ